MDFSLLDEDLLPKIIANTHLKIVKRLAKTSKILRKNLKYNHVLWNTLAQSNEFNIQKNIALVRNSYLIQRNIKRGQNETIITFNTNQKDLTDLQVTNDSIFCSSDDSTVKEFSYSGREIKTYLGHKGGVWAFTYSENYLITGSTDKTARIWDRKTGTTLCILQGHTSTIRALKTHSGFICTGGRDSVVRVWKFTGELVHTLRGHTESIRCLDMNDKYLVSGSYDGSVVLWNYKTGEKICSFKKHSKRVYAVCLGDKFVASSGLDAQVHISDLTGRLISTHKNHKSLVAWLSFTNKERKKQINFERNKQTNFERNKQRNIERNFERFLLSSGADNTLCKWDLIDHKLVYLIQDSTPITSHAVVNDLLIIATQKDVKVYDYTHGVFIRKLMEAESVLKMRVIENCIVVGFYSLGEYQIRVYKY